MTQKIVGNGFDIFGLIPRLELDKLNRVYEAL